MPWADNVDYYCTAEIPHAGLRSPDLAPEASLVGNSTLGGTLPTEMVPLFSCGLGRSSFPCFSICDEYGQTLVPNTVPKARRHVSDIWVTNK